MTPYSELRSNAEALAPGRFDANGVMLVIEPESDTLVVSCSGIVPENTIIYAMENTTQSIKTHKLYVCDRHSLWYYGGIEGLTTSFDETVAAVGEIVHLLKPRKTCVVGTSAGAHIAIVSTALLQLDRVLAFTPQTFLDTARRKTYVDGRWEEYISKINAMATPYDLCEPVGAARGSTFDLVFPTLERLDAIHAVRLANLAGVRLHPFATDEHNMSGYLWKKGAIQNCLDIFLTTPDAALGESLNALFASLRDGDGIRDAGAAHE